MKREDLDQIPLKPGVYLMHDRAGDVIYVGKANSLRKRVRSYFDRTPDSPRVRALVNKIDRIDTILVGSEKEALLLENNLIKDHQPRYNVRLKDDKKYPYIKVELGDLYPRVYATRLISNDGSAYFGPYTNVKAMRRLLKLIHQIFPVRTCTYRFPTKTPVRLCLDYQIGKCLGPCEEKVSKLDYDRMVEHIMLLLNGKNRSVVNDLRAEMNKAASGRCYEAAAIYRDQIRAIGLSMDRQRVMSSDGANRDVIALAGEGSDMVAVILRIRDGKLGGREVFPIVAGAEKEPLGALLKRLYGGGMPIPREILCDRPVEDRAAIREWLAGIREGAVTIHVPVRGEKMRLVKLAAANASHEREALIIRKLARKDRSYGALRELQRGLELPLLPRRIECFDISNLGDRDLVGSSVCFLDGLPEKSRYRKYKIRTVGGIDDFASMGEVVLRRFRRLLREGDELPDLVLIDGGKGQLAAAVTALQEANVIDVPVISLAKRLEEVFRPGFRESTILPEGPALHLLKRLRDEAHRFAITFQRRQRGRTSRQSALDGIPGIGADKKRALLRAFGSVKRIRGAALEQLTAVGGIGPSLARAIRNALQEEGR